MCIYRESKYIKEIEKEIESAVSPSTAMKLAALKGKTQDVKKKNWISLFCAISIISFALMFFGFPGVGAIVCIALAIATAVFTLLDKVVKLTQSGRSDLENQFYLAKEGSTDTPVIRIDGNANLKFNDILSFGPPKLMLNSKPKQM